MVAATQNIDFSAECAVIGSMLIDSACVGSMLSKLRASDFSGRLAREAFSIMERMVEDGRPLDAVLVQADATDAEQMGGYLLHAMDVVVTTANADEYAEIVRRDARRRRTQDIGVKLLEAGQDFRSTAVESINELDEVVNDDAERDIIGAADWERDFRERQEVIMADPAAAYCETGYADIDRMLGGGLFRSGLYILGARPGMGKTTVAINIAERVSRRGPVLFVSLEMNSRQIMCKRISAMAQNLPYQHIMSGRMTEAERVDMEKTLLLLKRRQFYVNQTFGLTVSDIAALSRRVKDVRLIVVDYFGLIAVDGDSSGRYEDYTAISGKLKQLACQLNVPILCLAQLNRENEKRGGDDGKKKRPKLSDLRDTGAIEQDADGVLFLWREDYYKDTPSGGAEQIEITLAKNRHGETGTAKLSWYGEYGRLVGLDNQHDEEAPF